MVHVHLLGPLTLDGIPVPGARLAALAEALVLARGRVVTASGLVDDVWGDDPPADPAGALQALASRLRRLGLTVQAVAGGYRADLTDVVVDAFVAQDALTAARDAAARHAYDDAARLAEEGLAQFAGVAADDAPDVGAPLVAVHRRLVGLSVEADLGLGRPPARLDHLLALTDATPTDEPLTALTMRSLAASGREAEALARFETLRRALADTFGTDPSPVVASVHLALVRGELSAPAAPPVVIPRDPGATAGTAQSAPPNAPVWRPAGTPLIGRTGDIAAVEAALRTAPVVTIVGVGGAGKTRLAAEVARRFGGSGRPVRAVELAGARTPEEVLPALLQALGGTESVLDPTDPMRRHPRSAAESLAVAARGLDGLLVVDNCEHLLDAVAEVVAQLVAAGPGPRVLATSRAPLGVVGEAVHPVATLPDDDALRLLRTRAEAARPSIAWADGTALRLCHALDNLPLALELAAARLRSMPLEEVLAGVGDRFALLDNALRGLPDRHRGLWAMVDWSWALLDPAEQALLRDLAVVPASFTAALAQAVAPDDVTDPRAALAGLVEQSLLVLDESTDGAAARYRMLETVREYGEARLGELGPDVREAVLDRLARWAEPAARDARTRCMGAGQLAAMAELAADHDTHLAVLRRATAHRDDRVAVAVSAALVFFWTVRGLHTEVVPWARAVLHADAPEARRSLWRRPGTPGSQPHPDDAGMLAVACCLTGAMAGDLRLMALALRLAATAVSEPATAPGAGSEVAAPRTSALLSLVRQLPTTDVAAQLAAADTLVDDADAYLRGIGHFFRAAMLENGGDVAAAHQDAVAAYRSFEEARDRWGMGAAAQAVGQWSAERDGPESADAERWLDLGISHLGAVGAEDDARALTVLRDIRRARQGSPVARAALEAAATSARGFERCQALVGLALLALVEGRHSDAAELAQRAARAGRAEVVSLPQALILIESVAAVILLRTGREVGDLLDTSAAAAFAISDMPVLGVAAVAHAELALADGDAARALELWALGTRLGARMSGILGPDLAIEAQGLADAAARDAALADAQQLPVTDVVARLRALLA